MYRLTQCKLKFPPREVAGEEWSQASVRHGAMEGGRQTSFGESIAASGLDLSVLRVLSPQLHTKYSLIYALFIW